MSPREKDGLPVFRPLASGADGSAHHHLWGLAKSIRATWQLPEKMNFNGGSVLAEIIKLLWMLNGLISFDRSDGMTVEV